VIAVVPPMKAAKTTINTMNSHSPKLLSKVIKSAKQAAMPEMIAELATPIIRRRGTFSDIIDDTPPMKSDIISVPIQREPGM
jgi:hypothetical protein